MERAEIKRIVNEIQSQKAIMQPADLVGLLKKLKQSVVPTEETLRDTKVGLTVGRLRQHESTEVSDLAKEIVKRWKSEVDEEKKRKVSALTAAASTSKKPTGPRSVDADGVKFDSLGDKTRDSTRPLIYNALCIDSGAPSELILKRAIAVEEAAFTICGKGESNSDYRNKMRSLFLNLKGKENPSLRQGVVSGDISAEKLVTMSSSDMASEERKQKDKAIEEENLFKSLGAGEQQAETDAFQCGKCKQRKTIYRQAQTRSADEPMTTFVTCVNCGNRWKFS
ncbi:Transcription elongation factor S-II AltName: Full=TFIIS [Serendipita indica DSM 11827]|uniref:Related to transcription elongation factor TFIIS n=1 Tax=Serendipita indica (strain DSM 11827) TaxID=1109443 RepID=G4T4Z5_SERID|nr:Transcription elongation factor S-II AltName: Full=TFIIS [Serendipita indica DSM 11827]CCA66319.1 related to transcription elongation factor TFIIS [Serendipita indica DSM 11827]